LARPLLNVKPVVETAKALSVTTRVIAKPKLAGADLLRRLKKVRARPYVDQLCRLDVGTHLHDQSAIDALSAVIESEFGDIDIEQRPIGFVQKCILGPEYDVHILDFSGASIVSHYRAGERMPDPFEAARRLALHPSRALLNTYAFVEVFSDGRLVAVYADGPVTSVDPTSI